MNQSVLNNQKTIDGIQARNLLTGNTFDYTTPTEKSRGQVKL